MQAKYEKKYQQLVNKIKRKNISFDEHKLLDVFQFCHEAHKDQLFVGGIPYIDHCIHVAEILIDLKMDFETIIGGLLHAVTNDTNVQENEIEEKFGKDIHELIEGLYQISNLKFQSKDVKQEDNLRKLILSIAKDIRVIIIKFAERLDNLRLIDKNIEQRNENFVRQIAQETIAIYIPLAHRLGISKLQQELGDFSFRFLNKDIYDNIKARLADGHDEQEIYIKKIITRLQKGLKEAGIEATISGRPKSIYSIHRKMVNRGYSFDKINDLLAIRIIVNEGSEKKDKYNDCYAALGVVQNLFKPVQSLYNDYIQHPRDNGYQSIHIKVIFEQEVNEQNVEKIVEIQIRTAKMHEEAESGIAAHWLYKEGKQKKDHIDDRLISLRQKIVDDAHNPDRFIKSLNIDDLFNDEIFIFSPDGDLWQLPKDSSPVDFAFHIHTDIGFHCLGAKVNGKIVPLNYKLQSGDTVEIITSNNQTPNQDWVRFVRTSRARNKIKRWIRIKQFEQSLRLGEELLTKSLKHYRIKITSDELAKLAKDCSFPDTSKLCEAIGRGEITPNYIIRKIAPEKVDAQKEDSIFKKFIDRAKGIDKAIKVQGLDNFLINFGKCCNPLPGDRIIGFVTKGRGVVIHRSDCNNVAKLVENEDRNIDVKWAVDAEQRFVARINMISENNRVFLKDVTNSLSSLNANIVSVDMKVKDSLVTNVMALEVLNTNHLNRIIKRVQKIKGIISVERIDGNGNSAHQ